MIFGLFKRKPAAVPKPKPRRKTRSVGGPALPPEPSTFEVTEGSDQTDWALWEDSVAMLDSQLHSLQPSVKLYRHEPQTATEFQELEAYARVKRKDP